MSNNKITINLENTHTGSFCKEEFLHIEAKNNFLDIVDRNLENISNENRVHNTILINGKRGYGKTSFMLSLEDILRKKYNEIFILKIIDPTIIETKENIFILVLSMIKKEIDKCLNNYCSFISQNDEKEFESVLHKLSSGLSVLDGVGGQSLFKESVWNEPELIFKDALKNTKGGKDLEDNFKDFLDISLKILNKKVFMVVFDDIDTASNQGEMILELIRKYLTSSRLFVVLLGDIELFNLIVRNMQWKKLNPSEIQKYESDVVNNFYKNEIDTLSEQYLIKILRNENVVYLKPLSGIYQDIDIKNHSELSKYLGKIVITIFKEHNVSKVNNLVRYFLNLPLRSIIQILQANGDIKALRYILFGNVDMKYTKRLLVLLDSLSLHKNEQFYQLYNYIKELNNLNLNYTFMPESDDLGVNSLNTLLNTHITNSVNSIQDICDYFVKFYMPTMFSCSYDYNTHSFKIVRYLNKDLRSANLSKKVLKGTISITNDEFKKLNLSEEEQAIYNIFAVGLFTKDGLKNYFSYWTIFGFLSDLFYFNSEINLDKLLQVKSFTINENEKNDEDESNIQEAKYNTSLLRGLVISENTRFNIASVTFKDVYLNNRQLNSIFTRIEYSIKYIDDNPSATLKEQLQRYIQATLNAFIVVVLENERGVRFNNALSLNSSIYKDNLELLGKYQDEYLWLYSFVELKIWNILYDFSARLDTIILTYDFKSEFSKIDFEGKLKVIKNMILEEDKINIYKEDIQRVINSIKQRRTLDDKLKKNFIKSLEKLKNQSKVKPKDDNK